MPNIKELVVYVPAKDFELSQRFYAALGFVLTAGWGGTMDCRLGGAVFRLQDYYVKDWTENFMMKFDVDDIGRHGMSMPARLLTKVILALPDTTA